MNTKFLKQGLILLLLSAVFASGAIYITNLRQNRVFGGNAVFARSFEDLSAIGTITVETPLATVNLVLKDNFWRVREADGYYAAYNLINNLFSAFGTSTFFSHSDKVSAAEEAKYDLDSQGIRITVKNKAGEILNSILIGGKTSKGLYRFAKVDTEPGIFLITGKFTLPKKLTSWLQQPLLSLTPSEISAFTAGETTAVRSDVVLPFKISGTEQNVDVNRFLNTLNYVSIDSVLRDKNFDKSLWSVTKKINIVTFDGMVVDLEIFTNQEETEYWTSVKFSTTTLPTTPINDYINNNAFLFDGWYFKLAPSTGRILFNAVVQ